MDLRQTRAPTLDELDKWISDVLEGRISTEADDGDYDLNDDSDSEGTIIINWQRIKSSSCNCRRET